MQTAELWRNAAQALGVATAKLEEVLQWMREMSRRVEAQGERITTLEATEREREKWNGQERRRIDDRLGSGDQTFRRIEQTARDAEKASLEAQRLLREVLQRRASDGTKVKSNKWVDLLIKLAPYIWGTVTAAAAWVAAHFTYTGGH